jgi:hypothetical protein
MNRKLELITKRNKDIFKDYCTMYFKEMTRPEGIYPKLVEKYYLDAITISRIITKQLKLENAKQQADEIP